MSRRNFILLIIVLIILTISVLLSFYFNQTPSKDEEGDPGIFSGFNPFSGVKDILPTTTPPSDTSGGSTSTTGEKVEGKLTKVSTMPIAGFTVFQKEREEKKFAPALRYVDRVTGNIYQTFADEIIEEKFSNTIVPKVYEALFGNNGKVVIMRYLKSDEQTIQTFLGNLPKEKLEEKTLGEQKIEGSFLPDNISNLSLSPDTTKLFYLLKATESVSGIVLNLKDNRKTQVFDSQFTEWLPFWPNSTMITLNTKSSGLALGYMYAINPSKKDFKRVLGNINGLATLTSPNGKLVLYSNSGLGLNVYNIDTRESDSLGISTLAEKCIWNKTSNILYCAVPKFINSGLYPDSWYKGETSFSDEIWKIDLNTNNTTRIIDPINIIGGEEIDGIKLALDSKEIYLFFINKKDSYLWKLDLE